MMGQSLVEIYRSSTLQCALSGNGVGNVMNGNIICNFKIVSPVTVDRLRIYLAKRGNMTAKTARVELLQGTFSVNDAVKFADVTINLSALKNISDTPPNSFDCGVWEDYTPFDIEFPPTLITGSSGYDEEPYVSNFVFIRISFATNEGYIYVPTVPDTAYNFKNVRTFPSFVAGNPSTGYWIDGYWRTIGGMVLSMWNSGIQGGDGDGSSDGDGDCQGDCSGSGFGGGDQGGGDQGGGGGGLPDLEDIVDDPLIIIPSVPHNVGDVRRDWWKWLLLLVVVALISTGVYYYSKQQHKK